MAKIEGITPQQQDRLDTLTSEIRTDKLTVSFSIEDRDGYGRKKSAFVSETASRGHGAEMTQLNEEGGTSANWSIEEAHIVHCVLSKSVIAKTYRDAVRRRIISPETAREELPSIMQGYDANIARILNRSNGNGQ